MYLFRKMTNFTTGVILLANAILLGPVVSVFPEPKEQVSFVGPGVAIKSHRRQ
jgi:hypothetical protein